MWHHFRYRLVPSPDLERELEEQINTCRQVYNHFLTVLHDAEGSKSRFEMQSSLPEMKQWWPELNSVYSKVLQMVVKRVTDNLTRLKAKKDQGNRVGRLKWKGPEEYRSLTYNQVGFELKNTSDQPVLALSKIGEIPIRYHRFLPPELRIKQVAIKKERSGEWYATFSLEDPEGPPAKPDAPEKAVGIDVGLQSFTHDTDGLVVEGLDFADDYERLERAQQKLARKEHGSNNWKKQRRQVARYQQRIKRKRLDFLHKLSGYYACEYDCVAVENLDVKGLLELPSNSKERASASWGLFLKLLEYKCLREGTHYLSVPPEGTTKECVRCGVETEKPLWVRKHVCTSCGFEAHRDANAAMNILARGLAELGMGDPEVTPVENPLTVDDTVSAKRVVEAGSSGLKRPRPSAALVEE